MNGNTVRYCFAYAAGKCLGEVELDDISEVLKREDAFVWLALHDPAEALLLKVQEEFGLHDLAIEDAQAAHQRPKLEQYGNTLFVVLKTAALWDDEVQVGETYLFLGPRFFITVRQGPSVSYRQVRERLESVPEHLAIGPAMAAHGVMDFIVDNYAPIADALQDRFEELESEIFGGDFDRQTIVRLYKLKREMLALRGVASPVVEIADGLMRFHPDVVPKEARVYFRDVHDHVMRLVSRMDDLREMLISAMQVNLALASVEQNEAVRRLAGWGAILAIPTVVFSMYGMNFKEMPELSWHYAYPTVLGLTAVACMWLYRWLKRYGWL